MFKKILSLALALALLVTCGLALASCGGNNTSAMTESPLPAPEIVKDFEIDEDFKIGFICLHDENSTYDLNFINAAKAYQEALGLKDSQVIIVRNIPETSACTDAAIDLVEQGCKVVFANSFGHEDFVIEAARQHSNVQFCHATGYKAATAGLDNYHNAFASIYEGRYLAGVAAGLKLNEMIEAGEITADKAKMGYVGAFTYAEVISGYTSFYLGAKSVCPSVTMDVTFTGSWYDAVAEKNAAEALIQGGCVLISQHADSMGAPGACETAGVPNVSYNGSTYEACPETFIVSSAINWAPYYTYVTKCVSTGVAIDANWCGGIKEGSVVLSGINTDACAEGTVDKIETLIENLKNGSVKVFDCSLFTVGGKTLTTEDANIETVTVAGKTITYFNESATQSAPYFELRIDGIKLLNENYG
ncbi:MAG: BMP family ABC transporter substrate-binding protein [Clostridia bacterium]|nr:BMP family ABC transporter substrate-binding protein [Clostridia bacterium]